LHYIKLNFVATAYTHHTQKVLDENNKPKTAAWHDHFDEMQFFMFLVLQEKLKSEKGPSLVNDYENIQDAHSVFAALKKHAKKSTVVHLSGDQLLQHITSDCYPGSWQGTSYAFVLHWKYQVMKYEKLELEAIPPKQKLRMLKNAVSEVPELQHIKHQIIAR
jgi:hypothetical protein